MLVQSKIVRRLPSFTRHLCAVRRYANPKPLDPDEKNVEERNKGSTIGYGAENEEDALLGKNVPEQVIEFLSEETDEEKKWNKKSVLGYGIRDENSVE